MSSKLCVLVYLGALVSVGCKARTSTQGDSEVLASGVPKMLPDTVWSCTGRLINPNPKNSELFFTVRSDKPGYIFANFYVYPISNSEMPTPSQSFEIHSYPLAVPPSRSVVKLSPEGNFAMIHASGGSDDITIIDANIDLNKRNPDKSFRADIYARQGRFGSDVNDNIWEAQSDQTGRCYPGPMRKK